MKPLPRPPLLPEETGFDYPQALRELNQIMSYEQIAAICGYAGREGVIKLMNGSLPLHPQGEAIYILYVETFNRKPPSKTVHYSAQPSNA